MGVAKRVRVILLIILFGLLLIFPFAYAEVFKWVDEKGVVHFTEDWEQIPEKYRDQVKRREMPEDSTAPEEKIKRKGSQREYEKGEAQRIKEEKIKKAKEAYEAEKLDISVSYKGRDTGYHIFNIKVKNNGTMAQSISPLDFMLAEEDNRSVGYTYPSTALQNQMPLLRGSKVLPGGFVDGYLFFPASKRGKTLTYMVTGEEFSVR